MASENSESNAVKFASRPMLGGKVVAICGLAIVAIASFLIPAGELHDGVRIGGLALVLLGGLSYGFGRLVLAANSRSRSSGPVA